VNRGIGAFAAGVVFATTLAAAEWAHANLVIVPTFASSITSLPNAVAVEGTINSAIAFYESTFTDPITVNITFQNMTSGLGQSSTFFANVSYASYLAALIADATTANDATALAHLPAGPNNPVNANATIDVKTANLRAVGLSGNPPAGQPDGTISLNTGITDVNGGGFSLFAVVEHEIDEVLGLGSSLPGVPFNTIFPEDLYRYNGTGSRSFTTAGTTLAYFSIDGTTLLAQFDNQNDGGDFGDWQSNPLPGGVGPKVQDAFATFGAHPTLGSTSPEVIALDAIGYNAAGSVPEPATFALLGVGLAVLGFSRRKLS
jgi:hypothetical protein